MCNLQRIIEYCHNQALYYIVDYISTAEDRKEQINKYIDVEQKLLSLQKTIRLDLGFMLFM